MEGRTFGTCILKIKPDPDAKIAVLYQNDDYGKTLSPGSKALSTADPPRLSPRCLRN
jgi:hypothetical protein